MIESTDSLWQQRRPFVETSRQKDEVDKLLEDPRYAQVGQDIIKLAKFFGREGWDYKRVMQMQSSLVHDLAAMPDWDEEDIEAIAMIKDKYLDKDPVFAKGFAEKQRKGGMTPDVWWAGFVGEAVFMRSWSNKAGIYIADRGEMSRTTTHDRILDEAGIDFVTEVDYSDHVDDDNEYQLFISFKTKSNMPPGEIAVVELNSETPPKSLDRYFNDRRSAGDLLQTVSDRSDPNLEPRVLFVLVGRGSNDWMEMMRAGNSQDFAMDMADKMDEVIRGDDKYVPTFMGSENTSPSWWNEVLDDERAGSPKRVPVNEKGQKGYKEFAKGFNTSFDDEE